MPVGAAIGGGALVSAGASIYSGNKAADAAKDGAKQSSDVQRYMYDTSREDSAPYREVGANALNQLASLYGLQQQPMSKPMTYDEFLASDKFVKPSMEGDSLRSMVRPGRGGAPMPATKSGFGGDQQYQSYLSAFTPEATGEAANTPDYSAFMNSPDYQFAYSEGNRAVEQNLARQGLTGSGAALKSLTRFGQGLASQQLGNYKNSLAALAGVGQTATSQINSLGVATGQGIGQNARAAGDARASSYLNTGSAVSNLANTGSSMALLNAGGYFGNSATPPPANYVNWNQGIV